MGVKKVVLYNKIPTSVKMDFAMKSDNLSTCKYQECFDIKHRGILFLLIILHH